MKEDLGSYSGIPYTESGVEKNNKKISVIIFIVGLIIALALCGVGYIKQNNAKKTNEERANQAYEQSLSRVESAKKRLAEIDTEMNALNQQYQEKEQEINSLETTEKMREPNWFADITRLKSESSEIKKKYDDLKQEAFLLENGNYTEYYNLIEPITYMIFYYIAAGVFGVL